MLKSLSTNKRPQNLPKQANIMNLMNEIQQQNHKCYFHGQFAISKFCTNKKCTLPLCQKCIPIHLKQHIKEAATIGKENIIPFEQATKTAVNNLQNIITHHKQTDVKIKQIVTQTRKKIENIIQIQFSQIQNSLMAKENEIKITSEKYNKIKKGSLKTLIFYFSDEETFHSQIDLTAITGNKVSQIPQLIQKLKDTFNNLLTNRSGDKKPQQSLNNLRNSDSQKQQLFQLKNYASVGSGLFPTNITDQIPTLIQQKQKTTVNNSVKLQSSSDFAVLLKDQRSRLQNVRNKNLFFAKDYVSQGEQSSFQKYGSKSVDNFYFTTNSIKEIDRNKVQKQNRPLQTALKSYTSNFLFKGLSQKKTDLNGTNSQEKLDKIRKKYVADYSLNKQRLQTQEKQKEITSSTIEAVRVTHNRSFGYEPEVKYDQNIRSDLRNKILSRQQIRVNIENRLNQKSIPHSITSVPQQENQDFPNFSRNYKTKYDLPKKQIKEETLKHPYTRMTRQEFTLNKNYRQPETYRDQIYESEKGLMSSIKRELRAQQIETTKNELMLEKFSEENSQKVNSFDVRDEKLSKTNDLTKIRQEITDFIVDKQITGEEGLKQKIRQKQALSSEISSRRDALYEQTKQSIKLSDPSIKLNDRKRTQSEFKSQKYQSEKKSENGSNKKQGRRFHYLYDMDQQSSLANDQLVK